MTSKPFILKVIALALNTGHVSTIYQLLENQCQINSQQPCIICGNTEWSYGELKEWVLKFKRILIAAGFQRSSAVAIHAKKTPMNVAAILATSALGGTFVPINPALKARQIDRIIDDCEASIFIVPRWNSSNLHNICGRHPGVQVLDIGTTADESLSRDTRPENLAFMEELNIENVADITVSSTPQDLAAILYTSGSTGFPKGVMLSNDNLLRGASSVSEYLENTPDDRLLVLLPISFDYGLNQIITALHVGATVVLMDYLLPRDVVNKVIEHRISGIAAVPHIWTKLAALTWPPNTKKTIRYITNSGGSVSPALSGKLQHIFPDTRIYLMYGFTEAFRSTYLPPDKLKNKPKSIGRAIPGAEIHVVREDGTECQDNEIGELIHGGPHVSPGYLNNAQASSEKFFSRSSNGKSTTFARSGDLVYRDSEGYFYFVARNSDLIKTLGFRISPNEVESVLLENPSVCEAVVLGQYDEDGNQLVVAVITRKSSLFEAELRSYCIREMPSYMVPANFIFVREFPLNQNGKYDMEKIKAIVDDHSLPNGNGTSNEF